MINNETWCVSGHINNTWQTSADARTVGDLRSLRVSIKDFEVKDVIGRGHFGEVQVVREKLTGDVYALKVLQKSDTLAQQNVSSRSRVFDLLDLFNILDNHKK